jgi:hypothetical protein
MINDSASIFANFNEVTSNKCYLFAGYAEAQRLLGYDPSVPLESQARAGQSMNIVLILYYYIVLQ